MRFFRLLPAIVLLLPLTPIQAQCTPVHLTAEQDHQRMLDLLHIQSLRPPKSSDPNAPNAANFDEAKAGPFSKPPDPLVMNNGKPVTSATMWWNQRRPEIVATYEEEVLGRMPGDVPPVHWEVVSTASEKNGEVPVITKKLVGHVDNSGCPAIKVDIQLTLSTPANAKGPVPVIMELDLSAEMLAMLAKRFPNLFKPGAGPTWQQQVLAKGWGYASYIPVSAQPDSGAGLTDGIIGLTNKGQPRSLDSWSVLRAWAWGASRALDYFETDKAVDAKHVGITGHSRYGKASLVAMAFDPRFAIGYISSSGESGTKLYRHIFGETTENQAGADADHWVDGNFLKYAGPKTTDDLPVDTNELIALCAPRPVFIGAGAATAAGDGWADPKGEFLGAVGASPVYELLGAKGLDTTQFPPMLTGLTTGALAYREHDQGHTPAPNWPYFLEWATKYM